MTADGLLSRHAPSAARSRLQFPASALTPDVEPREPVDPPLSTPGQAAGPRPMLVACGWVDPGNSRIPTAGGKHLHLTTGLPASLNLVPCPGGVDLQDEIEAKMAKNAARVYRPLPNGALIKSNGTAD
jgi:hypothetical protein